jgi:hypothetical protein
MSYTAKITGKALEKGNLRVQVEFKNEKGEVFTEYFVTSQKQKESWLDEQVKAKLAHLNELPALHDSIEQGREIVLTQEEQETGIHELTPRERYQADLAQFEKYIAAVAKGLTTDETEHFKALKKRLQDNFLPEYLSFF